MERIIKLQIERLPEGVYLATSEDVQGLLAQGRTVTETPEIARKLLQAQDERQGAPSLTPVGDSFEYPLVVDG